MHSLAVTGTCGKTSVVHFVEQILFQLTKKPILRMGTLGIFVDGHEIQNSHLNTPNFIVFCHALQLASKKNVDTFLIEMSSQALAEERLKGVLFSICVFTNFSQDHLDFHGDMNKYLDAKILLFTKHLHPSGVCILSTQSPEWIKILKASSHHERTLYLITDGSSYKKIHQIFMQSECCFREVYFLTISRKKSSFSGLSGNLSLRDSILDLIAYDHFETPLFGKTSLENLMLTYCICHAFGHLPENFLPFYKYLTPVPGRLQKVHPDVSSTTFHVITKKTPLVFVDYAHKPGALRAVLCTLRDCASKRQKIITVFGCGGNRDTLKRPVMGEIAEELSDVVILTSDNPRDEDAYEIISQIVAGMKHKTKAIIEIEREYAIRKAFQIARPNDIILIAGRGHETHQIIKNEQIEFSDIIVAQEYLNQYRSKKSLCAIHRENQVFT